MKKAMIVTTFFTVGLCVLATQGCTTHHHHYPETKSIGIASPPKGSTGTMGKPGIAGAGTAQAQRKAVIDNNLSLGAEAGAADGGVKGPAGIMPAPGMSAVQSQSGKTDESDSFDIPFAKQAILSILQWCIAARCGS